MATEERLRFYLLPYYYLNNNMTCLKMSRQNNVKTVYKLVGIDI